MLVGILAAGLTGCGSGDDDSHVPEDAKIDSPPDIQIGVDGPGSGTTDPGTTDPGGEAPAGGEAPPFDPGATDPGSEGPELDPGGAGSSDPPPSDEAIDAASVTELIALFADARSRDRAADVIQRRGATVVADLAAALDSQDPKTRAGAAYGLGLLGKDAASALPKLKQISKEQEENVRVAALNAIDAIQTEP